MSEGRGLARFLRGSRAPRVSALPVLRLPAAPAVRGVRGLSAAPGFSTVRGLSGVRGIPAARSGPVRARPITWALGRVAELRRFDWVLSLAVLGLGSISILLVWSASQAFGQVGGVQPDYLKKQLVNLAIGLILMLAFGQVESRRLRDWSALGYAAAVMGVVAVLSPLGTSVNGARAWISLPGGYQVEPSEYAKLGLVLITARILGDVTAADQRPRYRQLALAAACAVPVIILVAAEPALGVAAMLAVLVSGVIVLSGPRLRLLAAVGAMAAGAALAVWQAHLLKPYQAHRLATFINPSADPTGVGYSAMQAKIAIGSGGLLGHGLFHSAFVAGNFVPEQQTDFIFAVAARQVGFVGAMVIIALLSIVVVRALQIAARAQDQFGMLLAGGIAIWFAVQSFVNIGMTMGIVPVTGLPLPFVSYGGSAMFADMIAVGWLQAVHRRRHIFS